MWVIVPVKRTAAAKLRSSPALNPRQRAELSRLMFADVLQALEAGRSVRGVTVVSSDAGLRRYAGHEKTEFCLLPRDCGYAEDAMTALRRLENQQRHLEDKQAREILILPADIPQLQVADLQRLASLHRGGVTVCPAAGDGGTNALLFTAPLPLPLLFGPRSFAKYRAAAAQCNIPLTIARLPAIQHDIDREADLRWLSRRPTGGRSWQYCRAELGL